MSLLSQVEDSNTNLELRQRKWRGREDIALRRCASDMPWWTQRVVKVARHNRVKYWFMTRSSHLIHEHILDFDHDFERTLRRNRNQQDRNPPIPEPEFEEHPLEEKEEDPNMAADNRTIKELSASGLDNAAPLCIQNPMAALWKMNEFELKSSLLHHIPKFHGMSMEDPNKHLKEFEVVCLSMTHVNVDGSILKMKMKEELHGLSIEDPNKHLKKFEVVYSSMTPLNVDGSILKMKAFPFSLLEKAKDWLYELALVTITSWESMKQAFLEKFFPTSRVILLRKRISGIQQNQGESFPTYYERFKILVVPCPQYQMKEELMLQYFYKGLLPIKRQMLDASAGGALVYKTPMAAKTLIANRALNAQQYEDISQKDTPRQQVNEGQENQAKAMQNQDKRVDQMEKQIGQIAEFMQSKKEKAEKDILETFRKVQVNIPLMDAIKQVPRYAKFLKELCTTRKRISSKEVVKANHLIFPADFYMLEMDESDHSPTLPILLGRPFMKTARTKIDVFNGTLTMEFDGEVINFNLSDSIKYLSEDHSCFSIDVFAYLAQDHFEQLNDDALELVIARGMDIQNNEAVTMHPHDMNDFSLAVPLMKT
ncbi:unnamed protein product [Malus baccata var. baccata]